MSAYRRLLHAQLWDGDPTTEPDFDVEQAIDDFDDNQDINND